MSLDIILNNPEIAILGPPDSVNLQLDIGPQGVRGSKIYTGVGEPATNPTITNVNIDDLYIRTDPSGSGYVYQYLSGVTGSPNWVVVLQLNQLVYNARESVVFSEGTGTLVIPIYYIVGNFTQDLVLADLVTVFSAEYDKATAISLVSKLKINSNTDIELQFVGKEYDVSLDTWADIDNAVVLNLSISVASNVENLVPPSS
jgi:hypothetical protein